MHYWGSILSICRYFPHYFNCSANYNYIDKLPGIEYYGVDQMKPAARETFLAWHEEHKENMFNFLASIMQYCKQVLPP